MNTKHVSGISVVSISGGEKVGTIGDVYFDTDVRQVLGYTVTAGGGLLSSEPKATQWLPAKSVNAIGPDALTVRESSTLASSPPPEDAVILSEVMKRKVVTEGGTLVGQVASIELDAGGTSVAGVEVSPGFFKSNTMVPPRSIVSVGDELIVVRESVLAEQSGTTSDGEPTTGYRLLSGDIEPTPTASTEVKVVEAEVVDAKSADAKPATS